MENTAYSKTFYPFMEKAAYRLAYSRPPPPSLFRICSRELGWSFSPVLTPFKALSTNESSDDGRLSPAPLYVPRSEATENLACHHKRSHLIGFRISCMRRISNRLLEMRARIRIFFPYSFLVWSANGVATFVGFAYSFFFKGNCVHTSN